VIATDATRGVEVRPATAEDADFLLTMLYEAARWNPDWPREPIEEVLQDPIIRRYHEGWGRRGDAGVLAEIGGEPVGAAWFRLFDPREPGYGFVDETIPELGIAVVPLRRRAGIGTALLEALIERAEADGYPALSLSVAVSNRSRRMYERAGFRKVAEAEGSWTMRLDLPRPSAPP